MRRGGGGQEEKEEVDTMDRELRLARKLSPSLHPLELSLYTATWVTGVLLSLASLYRAGQANVSQLYSVDMVQPWWRHGQGGPVHRDGTDHEWETWKKVARHVGAILFFFPLLSQVIKRRLPDFSLIFITLYSLLATVYLIGVLPTLYLFLQILVMFLAFLTKSAKIVWVVAVGYILCLNIFPLQDMKEYIFRTDSSQYYEGYLTSVLLAWINARCVSFCLDRIWGYLPTEPLPLAFLHLVSYCFYLPLSVMGPLVSSQTYREASLRSPPPLDGAYVSWVLGQVVRYCLWTAVTDISLYFFYQQALTLHPDLVSKLSLWALCGMGYAMGQFFQLKYVVMYGWSSFLAKLDGVDAPPHPKCIGRIHLYSDMWRYFDHGLYLFMQRYIYRPVLGLQTGLLQRLLSSAVCFSFVYVWHGTLDFVMIWSAMNFAGITAEGVARAVGRNPTYRAWEQAWLSPQMARRLHALLAAPLLMMSSLSNFYFFTGVQVGHIFVRRVVVESWPLGCPTVVFFLYCCSQTSIEVKNLETKHEMLAQAERKD